MATLGNMLQTQLLQEHTANSPELLEPLDHYESQSTDVDLDDGELQSAFEDLMQINSINASVESLLINIAKYSTEGLDEQALTFATAHLNHLKQTCELPEISFEGLTDVGLESEANDFLSKALDVAAKVWKHIIELFKRFIALIKAKLLALGNHAKNFLKRSQFLRDKWPSDVEVEVSDPNGCLVYRGKPVKGLEPFKDLCDYSLKVGKATATWSTDARHKTQKLEASVRTTQYFMFGISDEFHPLPVAKELYQRRVSGDTYATNEFLGGVVYEFDVANAYRGSFSAEAETVQFHKNRQQFVDDGIRKLPILKLSDFEYLTNLVDRLDEAQPKFDEYVKNCEDIQKKYEELHSKAAGMFIRFRQDQEAPPNKAITVVLRAFSTTGSSLALLNQAISNDLYRTAVAHLNWASKSLAAADPTGASKTETLALAHEA